MVLTQDVTARSKQFEPESLGRAASAAKVFPTIHMSSPCRQSSHPRPLNLRHTPPPSPGSFPFSLVRLTSGSAQRAVTLHDMGSPNNTVFCRCMQAMSLHADHVLNDPYSFTYI